MPNRILKESICTSDSISALTDFQEAFYYRLIVNCDDFGRMDARPAILKARLYPLRERLSLKDIEGALRALADVGCVEVYEVDGKPFLHLPSWEVHQQIRAKKSKYPAPDCGVKSSDIKCNQVRANVPVIQSNPIRESESNSERKRTRFVPPTLEEVAEYVAQRGSPVDPQGFINFYASKGWMVGKTPMKDWKAACRNAEGWDRWRKNSAKGLPSDKQVLASSGPSEAELQRLRRVLEEVR